MENEIDSPILLINLAHVVLFMLEGLVKIVCNFLFDLMKSFKAT